MCRDWRESERLLLLSFYIAVYTGCESPLCRRYKRTASTLTITLMIAPTPTPSMIQYSVGNNEEEPEPESETEAEAEPTLDDDREAPT
jgi:hypothetical protein